MPADGVSGGELSPAQRRAGLAAVTASSVAVGLTVGMTIPLIALNMSAAGAGATLVGVNSAMPAVAVLVTAPFAPRVIAALGAVYASVFACALTAATLILFPESESLALWFGLRLAMGFGLAVQWVVSETWLSRIAPPEGRGRAVSLYATMWAAGMAAGPLLLQVTGITGRLPFTVAAILILLATVPPLLGRRGAPAAVPVGPGGGWSWSLFGVAPDAILAGFVTGFVEISLFTLLPLYAARAGLSGDTGVLMVSVLTIGGLFAQFPLGWLADRGGPRRVLAGAALVSLVGAAGLDLTIGGGWPLWPVLLVWGGAISGFYTLGLTRIGESFAPAEMAHANVLFIMTYTIGSVFGPMAAGVALDLWPAHGLPLAVGLVYCLYLAAGGRGGGLAR